MVLSMGQFDAITRLGIHNCDFKKKKCRGRQTQTFFRLQHCLLSRQRHTTGSHDSCEGDSRSCTGANRYWTVHTVQKGHRSGVAVTRFCRQTVPLASVRPQRFHWHHQLVVRYKFSQVLKSQASHNAFQLSKSELRRRQPDSRVNMPVSGRKRPVWQFLQDFLSTLLSVTSNSGSEHFASNSPVSLCSTSRTLCIL